MADFFHSLGYAWTFLSFVCYNSLGISKKSWKRSQFTLYCQRILWPIWSTFQHRPACKNLQRFWTIQRQYFQVHWNISNSFIRNYTVDFTTSLNFLQFYAALFNYIQIYIVSEYLQHPESSFRDPIWGIYMLDQCRIWKRRFQSLSQCMVEFT